jgi:hypothetical protein
MAQAVASRRGRKWDEDSIRAALGEFLVGWEVWPTCDQFALGGAKGLREAVGRIRGAEWWAKEMGLPGGDRALGGQLEWSDERIRATLLEFIGDRATWPSQREFDEAGLHAFREVVRQRGGPKRWAREVGVTWDRSRYPKKRHASRPASASEAAAAQRDWPLWNERSIRAALEDFLREREQWPRHSEFVASGHSGLYQAVLRHGGTRLWARRMGVRWVKRNGGRPYWSEQLIRERLQKFLAGRNTWPSSQEFAQAGEGALLAAVRRFGGVARWERELGIKRARRRRKRPRRPRRLWDDARIEAAIAPLVAELGRWPTKAEFRRAGLGSALSAVYNHGGSALWQRRLGLRRSRRRVRVPDRTRWTEQTIETELRRICRGRSTWPTQTEFKSAGASALYSAVIKHGGLRMWRERLGLD